LTDKLLDEYRRDIESLTLIPGSGGVFEVEVDGDLIYSKKETGRHTSWPEIQGSIEARRA
jgi:selenoprotein W-related protein